MKVVFEATLKEINAKRKPKQNTELFGDLSQPMQQQNQEITKEGLDDYKKALKQRLTTIFNMGHNDTLIININE